MRAVHAGLDSADGTDTGTVLSQGDAAHHGPQARALGTTGAGVKVGVISDSINQVSGGVASQPGDRQPARRGPRAPGRHAARHHRRGPGDGRDHLRRGPGHHGPLLLDRDHQRRRQGDQHQQPGRLGRQGDRRRHLLPRRADVPGRPGRPGRRRGQGGRRQLLRLGRQPRQAELGRHLHRHHRQRLRHEWCRGHGPDARHLHQPLAVHLPAVGRAVGRGDHQPGAGLLHRRDPRARPDR